MIHLIYVSVVTCSNTVYIIYIFFNIYLFCYCRILLDYSDPSNPVVAERVLLQPFSMLLALERNLCPWYTQVPTLSINVTMGELAVSEGVHFR